MYITHTYILSDLLQKIILVIHVQYENHTNIVFLFRFQKSNKNDVAIHAVKLNKLMNDDID